MQSPAGTTSKRRVLHAFRAVLHLVPAHARGELALWRSVLVCGAMSLAPMAVLFAVAMWMTSAMDDAPWRILFFVLFAALASLVVALLWWCYGLAQWSFRRMAAGHMASAAAVYVPAFALAFWVVSDMAPVIFNDAVSTYEEFAAEDPAAHRRAAEFKKSWDVVAVPGTRRLLAQGVIGNGSADALAEALRKHPGTALLELDSPGGYVHEMRRLEVMVSERRLNTLVRGMCASACTNIFLAGQRRYVAPEASFGFHQSGYAGKPPGAAWSGDEYQSSIIWRFKGIPEQFLQTALSTPYESMWFQDALSIKQAGFATHWWSDRQPGE